MIAVTGATGGVGGRVARALAASKGHDGHTYHVTGPEAMSADVLREHPERLDHLRR